MKKSLLLVAGAALIGSSAIAQNLPTSQVWQSKCITKVSPNGKWAVSEDAFSGMPSFEVINLVTGEISENFYNQETGVAAASGLGNSISNDGIVLADMDPNNMDASYYYNGEWYSLPLPEGTPETGNTANGITADGSRICGIISNPNGNYEIGNTSFPVVWTRNSDGTYGVPTILPYPEKDITGRGCQYTILHCISNDGKTIMGQTTDYSGQIHQPIIYREKEDGTWEYELIHNKDLYKAGEVEFALITAEEPEDVSYEDFMTAEQIAAYEAAVAAYYTNFPDYPNAVDYMTEEQAAAYNAACEAYTGEGAYPEATDYMSEEQKAAYNAAVEAYNNYTYPQYADYMTEEQIAAYNAAVDEYNRLAEIYNEQFDLFYNSFNEYIGSIPLFEMNLGHMSGNGNYYVTTSFMPGDDPLSWIPVTVPYPYVFNLNTGEYKVISDPVEIVGLSVNDEGYVLGVSGFSGFSREAYVLRPGAETFVSLKEYVEPMSADAAAWMTENMTQQVPVYKMDEDGNYVYDENWNQVVDRYEDKLRTGQPCASEDLSVIATWVFNDWDADPSVTTGYFNSYVISVSNPAGVNDIVSDKEISVTTQLGGVINITGEAQSLNVYDMTGRAVYSVENPGATVATGLSQGVYVVNVGDANGKVITVKAAF